MHGTPGESGTDHRRDTVHRGQVRTGGLEVDEAGHAPDQRLVVALRGELGGGAVVLDPDGGVRHVMARGRWHVRDGRPVVRGTFEQSQDAA